MKAPKTIAAVTIAVAMLSTQIALGTGTALAGTIGPANRVAGAPGISGLLIYAARTQALSANGTTSWLAICPAGFLPIGGGAIVQDPSLENVTQAGFHTNAATRKFDGYQASIHVSGLHARGKVGFAVQVACIRARTFIAYVTRGLIITADGTTPWGVACPAGTLPIGGGAIIQDPRWENVTQAAFHTNAATGKFDGYQASVHVSGLPADGAVGFIIQVACMPAAARLIYRLRTQVVSARTRPIRARTCHAGICPAGAMVGGAQVENVTQAGFHTNAATGKFDGYQAGVSLSTLPRGGKLFFGVQVACLAARTPPVYGPSAPPLPVRRISSWGVACPAGTIPAGGGAIVQNKLTGGKLLLVSGQSR
jgi:hypothetical protein